MPKRGNGPPKKPDQIPLIDAADIYAYLIDKAAEIAFGDVVALVERRDAVAARVARAASEHPLIAERVDVIMTLLEDHVRQRIPQIPYHTVAVLTVALFYLIEEVDLIPDFIPEIGSADDALVLALACDIAAPGLLRYVTWKDLKVPWVAPPAPARPPAQRRPKE